MQKTITITFSNLPDPDTLPTEPRGSEEAGYSLAETMRDALALPESAEIKGHWGAVVLSLVADALRRPPNGKPR